MAKQRIPGLLKPPNRRKPVRPPRLSSIASFPRGPRLYNVPQGMQVGNTGPGEPPPGFVTPSTSRAEWAIYWGLFKVLAPSRDPRDGRTGFIGIPGVFSYQVAVFGGRARTGGGAVLDFLVEPNEYSLGRPIAIRLQTEFWHIFTDSVKQAYEQLYRSRLAAHYIPVDMFEQNFMLDPTPQAVVIAVKNALRGVREPSPARGGNPLRIPANKR